MKLLIGAISISGEKYKAIQEEALKVFDEVVVNPFGRVMTTEEIYQRWNDCDAIICGTEKYTAEMLANAPKTLKVISKHGVGVDNIDLDAAKKAGIIVCNTPGANAEAVAEAALGLIIATLRKIPQGYKDVVTNNWKRGEGHLFAEKTLGVIGMGNIGKRLIQLSEPFGIKAMAYDPYFDETFAKEHNVRKSSIDEILAEADVVSLHVPSTPETEHLMCEKTFAKMKPTSILINTARGSLVDEDALYQALKNGVIAGAGLDVVSKEPLKDSPLFSLDNIVITPHLAGNTAETTLSMGMKALSNAVKVVTGCDGAVIVKC